jgi:hypothetical protein
LSYLNIEAEATTWESEKDEEGLLDKTKNKINRRKQDKLREENPVQKKIHKKLMTISPMKDTKRLLRVINLDEKR